MGDDTVAEGERLQRAAALRAIWKRHRRSIHLGMWPNKTTQTLQGVAFVKEDLGDGFVRIVAEGFVMEQWPKF